MAINFASLCAVASLDPLEIPSDVALAEFESLIEKSELLQGTSALRDARHALGDDHDVRSVAQFLISQQLLTVWQINTLLRRKFKGFLIDRYCIDRDLYISPPWRCFQALVPDPEPIRFLRGVLPGCQITFPEVRNLAEQFHRLNVPACPRVMKYFELQGLEVVVQEGAVSVALSRAKQLATEWDRPDVCALGWQIAAALELVHGQGATFLDLHPYNIRINAAGHVSILSLGCDLEMNRTAVLERLSYFIAPEARTGGGDFRSDYFSLGRILKFMLRSHSDQVIDSPALTKLAERDPNLRPQSQSELCDQLALL